MSATNFEQEINYDMALGSANSILQVPIDVAGYPVFSFQFFIENQVGAINGTLVLVFSNDKGVTFARRAIPNNTQEAPLNSLGTYTRFASIGLQSGMGSVTTIQADFTAGGITDGIIKKVAFAANLGNS